MTERLSCYLTLSVNLYLNLESINISSTTAPFRIKRRHLVLTFITVPVVKQQMLKVKVQEANQDTIKGKKAP